MEPSTEYQARLSDRRARRDRCWQQTRLISYVRLAAGLGFFAALWVAFALHLFSGWFSLLPLGIYIGLVIYHERLHRLGRRLARSVTFYERGLERIEGRWIGHGNADTSLTTDAHLYARDLDIFGKGSLFELMCTARTRSGEETLAQWLSAPASRSEILSRQEAVRELRDNIDLREDLAVLGPEVRSAINPEFMTRWATAPAMLQSTAPRIIAPILVAGTLSLLVYYFGFGGSSVLVQLALILEFAFSRLYRTQVKEVVDNIDEPAKELAVLGLALARVEREQFSSEKLRKLQHTFRASDVPISKQIRAL